MSPEKQKFWKKKLGIMDRGHKINQIEHISCVANLIPKTIEIVGKEHQNIEAVSLFLFL